MQTKFTAKHLFDFMVSMLSYTKNNNKPQQLKTMNNHHFSMNKKMGCWYQSDMIERVVCYTPNFFLQQSYHFFPLTIDSIWKKSSLTFNGSFDLILFETLININQNTNDKVWLKYIKIVEVRTGDAEVMQTRLHTQCNQVQHEKMYQLLCRDIFTTENFGDLLRFWNTEIECYGKVYNSL